MVGSVVRSLVLLILVALLSSAAQEGDATVRLADVAEFGAILTDADGFALYLNLNDVDGVSTCYGPCAGVWRAVLVDIDPIAGVGLDPSLIDTAERAGGNRQVTYGGWPLYRYARDAAPGEVGGQASSDRWYLIDPNGLGIGVPEPERDEAQAADADRMSELMAAGETVYGNICAACHGASGGGGVGQSFIGYGRLSDNRLVVRQIIRGGREMPGFGAALSDDDVLAVATYIRNAWGNEYGEISLEEVQAARH
jgi:mono/diheme cytochrome c family protein